MGKRNSEIIKEIFNEESDKNFGINTAKKFNGHDSTYDQINIILDTIKSYENYRGNKNLPISDLEKQNLVLLLSNLKLHFLDKMHFFKYAAREHNKSIRNDFSLDSSLLIDLENINSNQIAYEFDTIHNENISNLELITKIMSWSNKASKSAIALKEKAIETNSKGYNQIKRNLIKNTFTLPDKSSLCDELFVDNYYNKLLNNYSEEEIQNNEKYKFLYDLSQEDEYTSLDSTIDQYYKKFSPKSNDMTLNYLKQYNNKNKIITYKDDFLDVYTKFLNNTISEEVLTQNSCYKYIKNLINQNPKTYHDISLDNLYQLLTYDNLSTQLYEIKNKMIELFFKEYSYLLQKNETQNIEVFLTRDNNKSKNDIYNTALNVVFPNYFDTFSAHFDSTFRHSSNLKKELDSLKLMQKLPIKKKNRTPIKSILNFEMNETQIQEIYKKIRNTSHFIINPIRDFYSDRFKYLQKNKLKGEKNEQRY